MLEKMLSGYLEAAQWADAPEGSRGRFTKSSIEAARHDCQEFLTACGPLAEQAIVLYSAGQFGCDFWLTRCGHGVGFLDRDELSLPACTKFIARTRNGGFYSSGTRGESLGDALTAIAYGTGDSVSKFAHASLTAYRGWLYFN